MNTGCVDHGSPVYLFASLTALQDVQFYELAGTYFLICSCAFRWSLQYS